eukprot:TRINITY_DN3120_c0_g1_i1.p1 TRINITY_DN3120_c0_g1~~TRINITY_DN3120_c0_g1_i1.p1  ORF type:complete len:298 (-),score=76.09 TRINITY_DN3120_c0_g1_i1:88-981(-)
MGACASLAKHRRQPLSTETQAKSPVPTLLGAAPTQSSVVKVDKAAWQAVSVDARAAASACRPPPAPPMLPTSCVSSREMQACVPGMPLDVPELLTTEQTLAGSAVPQVRAKNPRRRSAMCDGGSEEDDAEARDEMAADERGHPKADEMAADERGHPKADAEARKISSDDDGDGFSESDDDDARLPRRAHTVPELMTHSPLGKSVPASPQSTKALGRSKTLAGLKARVAEERTSLGENDERNLEWKLYIQQRREANRQAHGALEERSAPQLNRQLTNSSLASRRGMKAQIDPEMSLAD